MERNQIIKPTDRDEWLAARRPYWQETPDGCYEWVGARNSAGYGVVHVPGTKNRVALAHRVSYEAAVGPIPPGLQLDHRCRNRACVRPDHLEPVSPSENQRRAHGDLCKRGHEYAYRDARGKRYCRECRRLRR